jgi:peptidoglycan hydrolase-like protein with peptidoglycan-binding domain
MEGLTTEEIRELQRELGVVADGIIGPKTRAAANKLLMESSSIAAAQFNAEKYSDVLNSSGLVVGTDRVDEPIVEEVVDEEEEVVVEEEEVVVVTGYPKILFNSNGDFFSVDNPEQEQAARNAGFVLSTAPEPQGGGFDLDGLNNILGQYATQSQVQETVRTGPSTFEQAKGLYPYLDDRLIRLFLNKYAESGNERLALAEMRADPIMVEIYPGIKRDDGSLRMTEQEYVAAVDNMKASVRKFNLNPNEFNDDIVQAIGGDVSPLEFSQRLDAGYEGVVNNIPQVKQAYLDNFGIDLPDESIFAMFVSPNVATKILEGQIRASQVIGEAEAAGFGSITAQVAQSLTAQGLTQEGARKGFGEAALSLPGIQTAALSQGRDNIGVAEYVEATQLGDAQQLRELQNVINQNRAESAAILGAATNRAGQVTGLIEQ